MDLVGNGIEEDDSPQKTECNLNFWVLWDVLLLF